jgi:hypothetical protein
MTIPLGRAHAEIWQCRLDETRESRVAEDATEIACDVAPKRVVTLELVMH